MEKLVSTESSILAGLSVGLAPDNNTLSLTNSIVQSMANGTLLRPFADDHIPTLEIVDKNDILKLLKKKRISLTDKIIDRITKAIREDLAEYDPYTSSIVMGFSQLDTTNFFTDSESGGNSDRYTRILLIPEQIRPIIQMRHKALLAILNFAGVSTRDVTLPKLTPDGVDLATNNRRAKHRIHRGIRLGSLSVNSETSDDEGYLEKKLAEEYMRKTLFGDKGNLTLELTFNQVRFSE